MSDKNSPGGFGMGMSLRQEQTVKMTTQLEDGEKEKVALALHYWETKPHTELKFPMQVMYDALGIKDDRTRALPAPVASGSDGESGQTKPNEFAADFVTLTAEEIQALDPEEKYGVLLGDCIFISEEVPEQYIPMVVANLGFLKQMGDSVALKEIVKDSSLDIDDSRHWTANILDIVLAGKHFADNPAERQKYLAWRKEIERTDFFTNEVISEVLRQRNQYRTFKRTTHPVQRSLMARKSWIFSGMLYNMGSQMVDENARMLGISKSDIIIRTVCDRYDDRFDPDAMCRLIDYVNTHMQSKHKGSRLVNFVDFSADPAGQEMADQADLLTEGVLGDVALMDATSEPKIFVLRPFHKRSLEAFHDRIAYFTRAGLLRSGMDRKMLSFLKTASRLLASPGGSEKMTLQLGNGQDAVKLAERKAQIAKKLAEIEAAHDKFIQLRLRFSDMNAVSLIPGKLEQNYFKILAMREQLENELKELTEAETSMDDVNEVLAEQKALLDSLVA